MRPASDAFRETVQGSHRLATQATVNDTTVAIIDGTVTLDSAAAVRGRCDVTIVDDGTLGLVPDTPNSLLAPYGNEVTLARGVTYPDTSSELVTLGVFGIQSVEVNDTPNGLQIRIAALDRAARFINARFEAPYQIAAGTNYADAILQTLREAWPDVPTSFATTALTTPSLIAQEGDDRWQFCQQMAEAIAMALYFDGDGVCVLASTSYTELVAELAEGEDGVLLEAGRNWTREGTYNRVIATGENTGETLPVRGTATDEDPYSPTYYYGPFGRVPRFYASPFITTTDQAQSAAASILVGELGTTEQVNFGSLVLPHLEPGDVLRITRLRAGIDEEHVLTSVTIPLTATATMIGQTRASRVVVTSGGITVTGDASGGTDSDSGTDSPDNGNGNGDGNGDGGTDYTDARFGTITATGSGVDSTGDGGTLIITIGGHAIYTSDRILSGGPTTMVVDGTEGAYTDPGYGGPYPADAYVLESAGSTAPTFTIHNLSGTNTLGFRTFDHTGDWFGMPNKSMVAGETQSRDLASKGPGQYFLIIFWITGSTGSYELTTGPPGALIGP